MVDLVEDWEDLADYARSLPKSIKAGSSYQLKKSKDGVEIKVRVCRYGFSKEFKDEDDVELIKILAFCKVEKSIKVTGSTPTDLRQLWHGQYHPLEPTEGFSIGGAGGGT